MLGRNGLTQCANILVLVYKGLKRGIIGMANMHKKQRRQDRDGLVMMAR